MQITLKTNILSLQAFLHFNVTLKIFRGEGGGYGKKNQSLHSKNLITPLQNQKGNEQQCLPFIH